MSEKAKTTLTTSHPAAVAWQRDQVHLDKIFDALDELDEAGGLEAAAKAGCWRPASRARAVASMGVVRDQLAAAIGRADGQDVRRLDRTG